MVDIHQEGHSQTSAPQKRHMAHLRRRAHCTPRKLSSWDRGSDMMQPPTGGNCACQYLVTWAARTWDGHKTLAQPSLGLCRVPENLNLRGLDRGSACNPGPASDSSRQSKLEPEQCRLGKHTHRERGQTQCGWDTTITPRKHLLAVFLPPHRTTEQGSLKKVTTTTPLCQGGN